MRFIKETKMELKKVKTIYSWLFAADLILAVMLVFTENYGLIWTVAALAFAALIFHLAFYKCPCCKKHLPLAVKPDGYCPYCGKKLSVKK